MQEKRAVRIDAFYKLHAKLILNRKDVPVDKQFRKTHYGFRAATSTTLLDDFKTFSKKKDSFYIFCIDWKQARDEVDHMALQSSLIRIGIPEALVTATVSMYKAPLFYVSEGGVDSATDTAAPGIRQGSPPKPVSVSYCPVSTLSRLSQGH